MKNKTQLTDKTAIISNGVLADVAINKVKGKHPKAEVNRDGALFFCHEGLKDLGAGFSKEAAWKSAASNIG